MAEESRLGASFNIDVTNLKAGLAQANRAIRESESEFRAAAAGMEDWTKSSEGLTKRQQTLNAQIDIQKQKVEALTAEKQKIINKMTKEGKSQDEIARAIDGTNKQIATESKQLDKLKGELGKTEKALDDLGDETEDFGDKSKDAGKKTKDLGDKAKDTEQGFTVMKGAIANLVSTGITALVNGCKNAITSIYGLAESTKENRTEMAKLEASFSNAGLTADDAAKSYKDLYGVLGDTGKATEASMLLSKIAENEEDLNEYTRILTGVFSEYGDSIPTEGLAEGISATAAMSSVQGVLADALEWQGVNLDEFNEKLGTMQTEEERAAFIQKTLTGLYGESADAYRENNQALIEANEAQINYDKTMNKFGDMIEPITTKVKEGFNKILEVVLELTQNVDMEAFGEMIDNAFEYFISTAIPKIIEFFGWIKDNGKAITTTLGAILAGFVAFKVVTGIIKAVAAAQAVWNAVMLASPLTWITLAIAAVVAAIVALIVYWDEVKKVAVVCWDAIKKAWGAVASWFNDKIVEPVKKIFSAVIDWFKNNWKNLILFIINPAAGVFSYLYQNCEGFRNFIDNVLQSIKQFFINAWNGIVSVWETVANWFNDNVIQPIINFFTLIYEFITSLFTTIVQIIQALFGLLANWINENVVQPTIQFFKRLWDAISGAAKATWDAIVAVWTVVSNWFNENIIQPVRNLFTEVWKAISKAASDAWNGIVAVWTAVSNWFDENIIKPIGKVFSKLWDGLTEGAKKAWDGVKRVFSAVGGFFSGIWDTIKTKFTEIATAIGDAISGAFKSVINWIIGKAEDLINLIPNMINKFADKLNSIPGVNITKAKTIELPRLAKGGVVESATMAMIGENGREAVIPLEKNTKWLDMLAEKLSAKGGGVTVNQTNNYSQAHSRYELYKSRQQTAAAVRLALGEV